LLKYFVDVIIILGGDTMYKILIIEDDQAIATSIDTHLSNWDFDTKVVTDFKNVINDFAVYNPQLVLLDISLPHYDGYYWCSEIRKLSKVPIIFISSALDNMNIVMAMSMGGDDFIFKPFNLSVLVAKIQAMLRRSYDFNAESELTTHLGMILNHNDDSVCYDGQTIELSKNEAKILKVLLDNKGKIVGRNALMTALWKTDVFIDENTLSVNIARLRKRLEMIGLNDIIKTKKGQGYIINE